MIINIVGYRRTFVNLIKDPQKIKKVVPDDILFIFYASLKPKAFGIFSKFKKRWQEVLFFAVKCLEHSIDNCLKFYIFSNRHFI